MGGARPATATAPANEPRREEDGMPGIFIGIGGIGGSIVSQVRQALNVRVAFAGDTPSAREAAGQFQFLLIDTWKDGASKGFDHAQVFDVPEGQDKFGVDSRIDAWYFGRDDSFPSWWPIWPERSGAPLKVGNYASGAGQLRIKGKLAYRIALSGQGRPVAAAVKSALHAIDSVLGPAPGIRTVPVYLVCSLGGGTGSGMVLTFAQHLRQTLPDYCPIVGVFPMAGVTELGPGGADSASIWANTDAALREIDYCQKVAGTPANQLTPFFQWPGNGHIIYGKQKPFEYVYLFGRENGSGQSLPTFSQYVDLMAETLIAESFSNLIDEGLQTGISGPHSQFIMNLQAKPQVAGRPTSYASAAVGALVYPAERIERHLARRYAAAVLDRMVQVDRNKVASRVDDFVKDESLEWQVFQRRLTDSLSDKSGRRIPLPNFPNLLDPQQDQNFANAKQGQAGAQASAARDKLRAFASEQYSGHLATRRAITVAEYASQDGGIRALAHELLDDATDPGALGFAYAVVVEIRRKLERLWHEANEAIEGNENLEVPSPGKKKDLEERNAGWEKAVKALNNGFGSGVTKAFRRNGKEAKQRFFDRTWKPLRDETLELERLVAGRAAYNTLVGETSKVEQALGEMVEQIAALRAELERSTRTDVGSHGRSGVLDLAVLDDPRLVAHRFDDLLKATVRDGADDCARRVTARPAAVDPATILTGEAEPVAALAVEQAVQPRAGIVRDGFDALIDPRSGQAPIIRQTFRDHLQDAIVADGIARLGREVRSLSVWDALAAECRARQHLRLEDAAVTTALAAVQAERTEADLAGVPPKDWEREVLRHFIRNRMFDCQKRVRPFWNLDGLMAANHGRPYHFIVIAADREAYREAGSTLGIEGIMESTAALMQAGTPKWLPGRDRIVLYAREGVAPLFYLNEQELKRLRDAAAQKMTEKFIYTDNRFTDVIDPVIWPEETEEAARRYAIGVALQLGVLVRPLTDGTPNGRMTMLAGEHREFDSVLNLDAALKADAGLAASFLRRVNEAIDSIPVADRDREVQRALHRARRLCDEAQAADRPAESRWWKYAEQALLTRLTYGQYRVVPHAADHVHA